MKTQDLTSVETTISARDKNFFEKAEENPCTGCSAPCCRMLLIPHPTPATYMDLDYIRYMVGFHHVQMILTSDGHWQVLVQQTCRLLDQKTSLCTVHNTSRKPKTCVFFNPYRCWYKRNFTVENPPDIIRVDMDAMEAILAHVQFDEEGNITEIPTWEFTRNLTANSKTRQKNPLQLPVLEGELESVEQRI
ncbi:MAG: YkgJ family cysteine cluster protein [Nitrospira sp.]|nr:YkgJ family cysteine cluster protein [Nitrospira sp.]